jgi:CheY-like chemotaxis protein
MQGKPLILIVDDDAELSAMVVVHTVPTGEDGERALASKRPDAVLLDVMLHDANGYDSCRRWRATRPGLGIVMFTARGDPMDRVLGLAMGPWIQTDFDIAKAETAVRLDGETTDHGLAGSKTRPGPSVPDRPDVMTGDRVAGARTAPASNGRRPRPAAAMDLGSCGHVFREFGQFLMCRPCSPVRHRRRRLAPAFHSTFGAVAGSQCQCRLRPAPPAGPAPSPQTTSHPMQGRSPHASPERSFRLQAWR